MSNPILHDVQLLDPGARVELFSLDATVLGGDVEYFHAGTNDVRAPIVWQGNTYQPWPIEVTGFELNGRGQLPTPKMRAANISSVLTALVMLYADLVGAKVIRRRTFARYLDGQPGADPTAGFDDDVYFVERKSAENRVFVEWDLASALDVEDVYLPRRQVIPDVCAWIYRSAECSYAGGAVADINDVATADITHDQCSHRLTGCRFRFGTGPLPFGNFPSAGHI